MHFGDTERLSDGWPIQAICWLEWGERKDGKQRDTYPHLPHRIPFYVAAPWSTIDLATAHGDDIPIEQRAAIEVTHHAGKQLTPHGVGIENPAFDVTPAKYVTAIVTERGVLRAPYEESLAEVELASAQG